MTASPYLLDANVLIAAKNSYYSFDLCPGFWDALIAAHRAKLVYSVDRIRDELLKGEDDLVAWVNALPSGFFKGTDSPQSVANFSDMQRWAMQNTQFLPAAKEEFAKVADCWLMAAARADNCTIVTHEGHKPEAKKRIPMPNVCKHFRIAYVDTFEMLRSLRATFTFRSS